ncbi:RNA pyrophosphohydrolase [Helicobacter muridarum]|uniref:NTPase n=1 Tax=Helicobacter muridarum TaxID=216 RepID=A0A099TYJ1_9HELI|nr:RNA pyrophosphohydrolase [Helicobacter muridarum]TLE00761.1 RNA pyrophosphohydrolase [Helicobacter muridarum]STQ86558.1 NTPase [Helicobacter muridarum]
MDTQKPIKNYRPNVAAVLLSANYPNICEFFIAERFDLKNVWQFPQGGIDSGESPKQTLYRELEEEIGTSEVEIIAEYPDWLKYDFPPTIAKKMRPFDGQIQRYFLVKLKSDSVINIQTKNPEFARYEFVDFDTLMKRTTHFKKHAYIKALQYFKKEGYI